MIYRNRSQTVVNRKIKVHQQSRDRLAFFPGREDEDGYIGKKQFSYKYFDKVSLESPDCKNFIRLNKMETDKMDGAHPNLNIQCIENTRRSNNRRSL